MSKAELRSWLTPAAPSTPTRPLAASLPVAGSAPVTAWLTAAAPAPSAPARCDRCDDLHLMEAGLARAEAEALARGRAAGLAETERLRAKLTTLATALSAGRTEREAVLVETIVDVALGLCEWLAPAAAAIDRRGLAQLVSQALAAGGKGEVVLRMNGDDAAELGNQIPAGVTCEVTADLAPGEVCVEAPRLVVDARWPTRLAALREPLLALLRAAAPSFELSTDDERPASMSQRIPSSSMSQRIPTGGLSQRGHTDRLSQRIPVASVSQRIPAHEHGGRARRATGGL